MLPRYEVIEPSFSFFHYCLTRDISQTQKNNCPVACLLEWLQFDGVVTVERQCNLPQHFKTSRSKLTIKTCIQAQIERVLHGLDDEPRPS